MAHSGKTITFGTDLFPQEDSIYKLGSSDKKWNLYANQISGLNKFNAIITGSGTTAVTSGTKMPALWRFNLGIASPSEGDIVTIKIPVAGHGNGVFVSLDNGTTYYPVSVSGTSLLTTHYKANQIISLVCVGSGGTNAIYPAQATINGNSYTLGTSTDITGKHWCVLNYYDSGNTNTLMRTYALSTTTSLPLLAGMTDTEGNWTNYTSSYKALYGAISSTDTDRPTIDLPTGHITVPGGITGDLTGNATTATTASFIGKGSHTTAITVNEFTPAVGTLTILGNVSNTSMPNKTNNANAEVIVKAHPTSETNYYEARLGFNSNGNLYHMPVNGNSWKTILDSSNYTSYAVAKTGATMSGELTLSKANGKSNFGVYVAHTNPNNDTTKSKKVALMIGGSSGSGGLYDVSQGKWIVYSDTDGNITLNGNATTATTATGVSQNVSSTASYRKILLNGGDVYTAWNTDAAARTGALYQATSISVQPSTGTILANKYIAESTDDASSTSTGTLIVNGGVGIAKKLYVGTESHFSGAIYTANNTWNQMGDDAYFGDINKAGHIGIQGKNGNTGIFFTTYNQTTKTTGAALTWDGTNMTFDKAVKLPADPQNALEAATKQYVDNSFATNDAMIYKGVLNGASSNTNGGTLITTTGNKQGHTYKVGTAGYIMGEYCETGDMIICVTDCEAATTSNYSTVKANWTFVQTNLTNAVVTDTTGGENGYLAKFSAKSTLTKGPKIGTSTTTWLNEKGEWSTPTAANVGAATSGHTHGNITNGGGMTATGAALANGDTLLFVDSSETNKLIKQTSITFDGSTTTQALSKKGSWESTVNVNIAADDTTSTDNYPIVYATGKVATTTAQNSGLKKTTTKLYFQPSTGTLTATKFSGELSGNASSASKISAKLVTNKKIYFLGTETTITSTAANVSLEGDTGVYITTTAGEFSAVRHSYNVSGTEKAYTTYNTTDDSIDFIFI